ncbi:MAG TPA: hypothetical protein VFF58_00155 [Candidatus Nitrosotalea sp.]|nr:hypothetical protein [Candidatus Nitrosotalea sp.]
MANEGQLSDPPKLTSGDDIDKVLGQANPNPTRAGCPGREVLIAISRRERPIGDPAYEHLLKCSPCYREFRALQQSGLPKRDDARPRAMWLAASAAALLLMIAGAWFVLSNQRSRPPQEQPGQTAPAAAELRAELDLRKYSVARTDQSARELPPVSLPRGRLTATILLPVGSEPGPYEVQILDSNLRSVTSASGDSEIRDFVTTLRATIDLGSLPPGTYQLALRRHGEDWRLFPATVK